MSTQTRKERKEEDARILSEFQEALKETSGEAQKEEGKEEKKPSFDSAQPQTIHCRKCKTLMENGVCPACGFKIYMPMSDAERKKIRRITTVVAVAVFIVLFAIIQITK